MTIVPGCVTPTEIGGHETRAFGAQVLPGGGVWRAFGHEGAQRAVWLDPLCAHGGVNEKNCGEYSAAPFVHAIGGSWVCTKADIAAHNFEKITQLCKAARAAILGFEVGHVGVNCKDDAEAQAVCDKLTDAFSFPGKDRQQLELLYRRH